MKTPEQCVMFLTLTIKTSNDVLTSFGVFTVNLEHIWHIAMVFSLLTLNEKIAIGTTDDDEYNILKGICICSLLHGRFHQKWLFDKYSAKVFEWPLLIACFYMIATGIFQLKINNRNTRTRYEISSYDVVLVSSFHTLL